MKCPKCSTETTPEALCCPRCKLATPKGRSYTKNKDVRVKEHTTRSLAKAKSNRERRRIGPVLTAVIALVTIIFCGLGSYVALTYWQASQVDPNNHAQLAMDKVRRLPSTREGLTVEDALVQEVEKARDEGRLVEPEGWDVKPDAAGGAKFIVTFSFQLKDKHQHAQWVVDIAENTFDAKTELATAIYKHKQK
ncbi:MAG: hypothetical protein L0229_17275 [Blastocatellia bacterium]|nr:hypothetical protein [Blastocatellia bacterium]